MKKLAFLLVLLSVVAMAQQAVPPVAPTNVAATRELTPTYSEQYCAGFISKQAFDRGNFVTAGQESPQTTLYASPETVFLKGAGYQENQLYAIVRPLRDPNRFETFPGQHRLLAEAGQPYAELGHVRIVQTRPGQAIAKVEFSCQPIAPGDLAVPFQEKPPLTLRKDKAEFNQFPATGKPAGRIVMAKDFDMFVGAGQTVYITAGADRGIKVGDYLQVLRGYDPAEMDPTESLSYRTPNGEDTQKNPPRTTTTDTKRLPRRALGEIVILNVTPTSATGLITRSVASIKVGDTVEVEPPQQ